MLVDARAMRQRFPFGGSVCQKPFPSQNAALSMRHRTWRVRSSILGEENQRLTIKHQFISLIATCCRESHPSLCFDQFHDFDTRGHRVADQHWSYKAHGLRHVYGAGPRQSRCQQRRDEAAGKHAMCNACAESPSTRRRIIHMRGIQITRNSGVQHDVGVSDDVAGCSGVAYGECGVAIDEGFGHACLRGKVSQSVGAERQRIANDPIEIAKCRPQTNRKRRRFDIIRHG